MTISVTCRLLWCSEETVTSTDSIDGYVRPSGRRPAMAVTGEENRCIDWRLFFGQTRQYPACNCDVGPRYKGKVRLVACQTGTEGCRGIGLPILNLGAQRRWVVNATPRQPKSRTPPPGGKETGCHCTGGRVSLGWCERVRKILSQPGFEPRTVQPVVRRYTVYTIPDACPKRTRQN